MIYPPPLEAVPISSSGGSPWNSRTREKLRVQQDLSLLGSLEELVGAVEAELGRLSTCEPWVKQVPFLVQLPGLGVLSVMSILAAIGDVTRFPSAKKLVGYAGLGASVHDSGETHQGGHITKEGRRDLRGVMVEAAWVAVEHHPHWQAQFERLTRRIGKRDQRLSPLPANCWSPFGMSSLSRKPILTLRHKRSPAS